MRSSWMPLAFGLALVGCESLNRVPSSSAPPPLARAPQSLEEFVDGLRSIERTLGDRQRFTPVTCRPYIESVTSRLFDLPSDSLVPREGADMLQLKSTGPDLLTELFRTRLALRDRLKDFEAAGPVDDGCLNGIRRGFRYLRFAEEFLTEWLQARGVLDREQPPILQGGAAHTQINPSYADASIRAGDLLLVRGKAFVSAMIARIGDEEAQFSHIAIVGESPTGELAVVEALIQDGTKVTPLKEWLKQEDTRVVLFRQRDEALARAAARAIYDKAFPPFSRKANIRYDFAMNDDDEGAFFCAEVVQFAYKKASQGALVLPLHRTHATKFRATEFLKNMGIARDDFFAPSDIEVDTRFDLVAEYRHWPLLRQVRMQDSVLTSMYGWMIAKHYRFETDVGLTMKGWLAKFLRQFGWLADQLPTYMPQNTLRTTLQFQAVTGVLEKNIYAQEAEFFRQQGHSYTFKEMLAINEEIRGKDCVNWVRARMPLWSEQGPLGAEPTRFTSFFHADRCD